MFGPRLTRVFASRNNALWWSAMVLVTAYCVAAEPPASMDSPVHDGIVADKAADDPRLGAAGRAANIPAPKVR